MLTANRALLASSTSDPCIVTAHDFPSASPSYNMSLVPSMLAKDLQHCADIVLPSSVNSDSNDLIAFHHSEPDSPLVVLDNEGTQLTEQMIDDKPLAKFGPQFCRNKRKNFRPRCFPEEEDDKEEEENSVIASEGQDPSVGAVAVQSVSCSLIADLEPKNNKLTKSCAGILAPSSPAMADSIFNQFISNLNEQALTSNGKLEHQQPQALDLSSQEQLQQNKQLAELLFLKNIRNLSMFYPHLTPNMFMQAGDSKLPADSASELAVETKEALPEIAPVQSEPTESAQMEAPDSLPIEQLMQLYGFNRDLYLKAMQLANRSSQADSSESMELGSRNEESDQESQASLQETFSRTIGDDLTMETNADTKSESARAIDIEKLKQLQNLYKLNLLQQQMEQNNECKALSESMVSANLAESTQLFSSLENSFNKLPVESQAPSFAKPATTNSTVASSSLQDNYFGDIFKSKATNAKPSRRPLSSWKQSISACGPGPAPWVDKTTLYSLGIPGELINKSVPIDYTHYVKRYGNSAECGNNLCKELNYREHFHCNAMSCNSRVFMKKEEMIRHFKWHKKRDESLTHGFLRCSPADNCLERFRNCPHHRKQTHYHCLKRGCDKVYISTSDVQMHANYHRKDTAIIQEGFQRFRATENCLLETCAFFGQKTTHFHCRRDNCNHTFKNKADMEKHKSYHIRDEQLARDGFKKFMKQETCTFEDCRSSRVCNHIHCIRPGCSHVLHSTGQLYPHKRKHERRENELAYRKYRLAQNIHRVNNGGANADSGAVNLDIVIHESFDHLGDDDSALDTLAAQLPLAQVSTIPLEDILGEIVETRYLKYIHRHTCGSQQCHFELSTNSLDEHYCCIHCSLCWLDYPHAIDHAKKHAVQEEAIRLMFEETSDVNLCTGECPLNQSSRHYHCRMFGCSFAISTQDKSLRKLEHYKFHEEQQSQFVQSPDGSQRNLPSNSSMGNTHNAASEGLSIEQLLHLKASQMGHFQGNTVGKMGESKRTSPTLQVFPTGTTLTSVDGLPVLKRKRGRPPKNRSSELLSINSRATSNAVGPNSSPPFAPLGPMSSFDLAAAFNLPLKHANVISSIQKSTDDSSKTIPIPLIMPYLRSSLQNGFYVFDEETPCPDLACVFFGQKHFHCSSPRCYCITNREEVLLMHSRDFHDNIDIMEGYCYFDENIDCKLATCPSNRAHKHFHCTRVGCHFTFVHYSLMCSHEEKHRLEATSQSSRFKRKYSDGIMNGDEEASPPVSEGNHFLGNSQMFPNTSDTHLSEEFYSMLKARKSEAGDSPESGGNEQLKGNLSMMHSIQSWFQEQAKMNALNALSGLSQERSPQEGSAHVMYSELNPCGSPFCKLKRKNHFHCNACNQAFSTFERLIPHATKYHGMNSPVQVHPNSTSPNENASDQGDFEDGQEESKGDSEEQRLLMMANLQNQFAQNPNLAGYFLQIIMNSCMNVPSTSTSPNADSGILPYQGGPNGESSISNMFSNNDSHGALQRRGSFSSEGSNSEYLKKVKADDEGSSGDSASKSPSLKLNTPKSPFPEESSPNGYLRFRFNEDCSFTSCVYREHQTHFHCMRKNCGYSFCDRTRFVQHTARHERLDSLMGNDFRQFRSSVNCGTANCAYSNTSNNTNACSKTSHFHCLKCTFSCSDTNKVVAHRRYHEKINAVNQAGFEKFSPTQDCEKETCNYKLKQTHYHCVTCQYSVLGLTGMSAHKFKHQQQQEQQQKQPE